MALCIQRTSVMTQSQNIDGILTINRPFSHSAKEHGSSDIFINFYTRGSTEWCRVSIAIDDCAKDGEGEGEFAIFSAMLWDRRSS